MNKNHFTAKVLLAASISALVGAAGVANATEPCGDFGECKALVEINASDGDIGFHFLGDGDNLVFFKIKDPSRRNVYKAWARGPLHEQFMTEMFVESAEPLCFDPLDDDDPDNDDEDFTTLEEFVDRWESGRYKFRAIGEDWEVSQGSTLLGFDLPAAPNLDEEDGLGFDGSVISWEAGDDLGECGDYDDLVDLVADGVLPEHPEDVEVAAYEVVLEPDTEDGDPTGELKFTLRVPGDTFAVTVPADYLASLPDDTPVKIEVGAIGTEDNATFSEEDGFCVNEVEGCEEED